MRNPRYQGQNHQVTTVNRRKIIQKLFAISAVTSASRRTRLRRST
jgi:hypothetical protein